MWAQREPLLHHAYAQSEPRNLCDYPERFKEDRNKYKNYLTAILKLIQDFNEVSSSYVSLLIPKSGEDHMVPTDQVKEGVFQKDKPRPRLISGPADQVGEVKAATTWLL